MAPLARVALVATAGLIGVIVLIVWVVKRFTNNNASPSSQTPREILQARYARGEITRDQYQQMLQDIS